MKARLWMATLVLGLCCAPVGQAQTGGQGQGSNQQATGSNQGDATQNPPSNPAKGENAGKSGGRRPEDIRKSTQGGTAGGNSSVAQTAVHLKDAKGQDVGTAAIRQGSRGIVMKLDLRNLPAGEHAIHFHQVAKCDPPDFKSAGPHFNPSNKQHGLKNDQGSHEGDMDNIKVKKDGTYKGTISNDRVGLGNAGVTNSLFANGGTALVIHAQADDQKTDPSGNSGDRIACGIVSEQQQ